MALHSDGVAIVPVMAWMKLLDFLHGIKPAHGQFVALHAPYSPYLPPPSRPQWSFSTYCVDFGTKSWKIKNFTVNFKFEFKNNNNYLVNFKIIFSISTLTCVSVSRNDAANPARSDELKYLEIARLFFYKCILAKSIRKISVPAGNLRVHTFSYRMLIQVEKLVRVRKPFGFFYSVCNASFVHYRRWNDPCHRRHHPRLIHSLHHRYHDHVTNLAVGLATTLLLWWWFSVNLLQMVIVFRAFSTLQWNQTINVRKLNDDLLWLWHLSM